MQILLNGESRDIPEPLSAGQLLELLELGNKRVALEINQEIVPRSEISSRTLCRGDRVEIVQAIGGG